MCMFCFLFPVFVFFLFLGAATMLILFFLNDLVLYFHLEQAQQISFCRCFLILNPAVFCVDDGDIL